MEKVLKEAGLFGIYEKVLSNTRLSAEDGELLFSTTYLPALGYMANLVRERLNGNRAYYIYNQHINYSNICINLCKFCAFGKEKTHPEAYEMSIEEIVSKIRERHAEPITEVHIVGGLHPDLPYQYYLDMLKAIKAERSEIHIQAFTCVEIAHLAAISGRSITETLEDLIQAGLGSIPGGGAEVFSTRVRKKLCPIKLPGKDWLEVAKTAHRAGLRTNATMLYGHIETIPERIEHLLALREAQDETGGFLCYIPLAFHPKNTKLEYLPSTGGVDDLKSIAVSRLLLDNFPHIKAYWVMLGPKVAQIALSFGADDLDGTIMEEKITHMAGADTSQAMTRSEIEHLIQQAARKPVERDSLYEPV
jgi:aminodeoxyfutalosine synthase